MKLTLISIQKNGADQAVLLNGEIILSADPDCGDSLESVVEVADNLEKTLGVKIDYIAHSPEVDWNWGEVVKDVFTLQ